MACSSDEDEEMELSPDFLDAMDGSDDEGEQVVIAAAGENPFLKNESQEPHEPSSSTAVDDGLNETEFLAMRKAAQARGGRKGMVFERGAVHGTKIPETKAWVARDIESENESGEGGEVVEEEPQLSILGDIAPVLKEEVSPSHFSRLEEQEAPGASLVEKEAIVRWEVPGCDGFVLDHVLSREECQRLIEEVRTPEEISSTASLPTPP